MGATKQQYLSAAPEHSFLHVSDFESPQHLAEYLRRLDGDDDAYNEYFKWKGTGEFVPTSTWCRICAMLHDPSPRVKSYPDVGSWWRDGTCAARQ
jgi:glycoprotein 3-alpha-L-fucosyltransferase